MAREYIIKISNWKKYQNREVKTRSIWLRLQNDFIESPNFSTFSSDERIVWLHILCCASRLNTDALQVPLQCNHQVLYRSTGIDEKTFHRAIEKLKKLRIVEIRTTRGRYADDASVNADDTLHNETETRRDGDETVRDKTSASAPKFDFEILYQKYPLKLGKSKGIERCEREIKTEEDYRNLSVAIDRYRSHIKAQGIEEKFIKHFSTFMSTWRDWLSVQLKKPESAQLRAPLFTPLAPLPVDDDTAEYIGGLIDGELRKAASGHG